MQNFASIVVTRNQNYRNGFPQHSLTVGYFAQEK